MSKNEVRIAPLAVEKFNPQQAKLVGDWSHLNFSRVMIKNPRMYESFVGFLRDVITKTALPVRDRQIVVLRMLELCEDVYEVTHHVNISLKAGLTEDEIAAMREGDASKLTDEDRATLAATEELYRDQYISDATWKKLAARFGEDQLIELVCLAGCYQTMGMLTKSLGMELEPAEVFAGFNAIRKYT